ncbi:zinc finger FYVE domain-containing protein 21-like [Actinia tenebrosa]|uniref:Zinc finger FYVE domain-containing protein 21-like n=1 Tax=Actinia tenebrosa TaxID=6105 RepID=A0A6P8IMJ7_ACTTE|nr:zinc finger FYVE domain-containing protein 21-like [Actinia tenebrosa]
MSNKQLIKSKSGLRMVSTSDADRSPFLLEEPHWEDDALFPNCVKCNIKFDFTHRRHHCRRCGRVFCNNCCDNKVMLERLSFVDPVRVCEQCSHVAKKEEEFFSKHLKLLCHGAKFIIDDSAPLTFVCKLENKTHRTILFECDGDAHHDPVALISLVSVQLITEKEGEHINGIVLKYKEQGNVLEVHLHAVLSPEAERRHSLAWIAAMQRAIKMLFEVGS